MKTIVDLLKIDGIQAEHASGSEWHSPCPECGGVDRFSCWPDKVNSNGRYLGGRFVCRGCGFNGDAVAYLMKRMAITFMQAVKELGIDPSPLPERTGRRVWQPEPPKVAPQAAWAEKARAFTLLCQERLLRNSEVMPWLQHERGLYVETIQGAGLGWNDRDKWEDRAAWGLPPETSQKTEKPKKIWLPGGLVIPWRDESGNITRLRIRRTEPGTGSRYIVVSGSFMGAMILWKDQKAVCILESELDALLVSQEAGDIVGVVGMGSAQQKADSNLHERLMTAERILISLDADPAGGKAAWGHWRTYQGFKRWPSIQRKDPGEMFKVGIPIRAWIEAGL